MKAATTAYLRFFASPSELTMLALAMRVNTRGNSKLRPKAKISFMTRDRYSLTLASSWIGNVSGVASFSKLRKNSQATGIIT